MCSLWRTLSHLREWGNLAYCCGLQSVPLMVALFGDNFQIVGLSVKSGSLQVDLGRLVVPSPCYNLSLHPNLPWCEQSLLTLPPPSSELPCRLLYGRLSLLKQWAKISLSYELLLWTLYHSNPKVTKTACYRGRPCLKNKKGKVHREEKTEEKGEEERRNRL